MVTMGHLDTTTRFSYTVYNYTNYLIETPA